MSEYTSEVGRIADAVNNDDGGVDRSGIVSDGYSGGGDDGVDRSGVVSDDFSSGGRSTGGSSRGGGVDRSGVVSDDYNSGGPSTRTVSGATTVASETTDGDSPYSRVPDAPTPTAQTITIPQVRDPGGDSGGEYGTIADARIPGTDSSVIDALDRGGEIYRDEVTDRAASLGRQAGETDLLIGPAGGIEGSEERGQVYADFGRSAAASLNVPAFGADTLRIGAAIGEFSGNPDRAREAAEAGEQAAREGAAFAQNNPARAGAMFGGALLGGFGLARAATGASRAVRATRSTTRTPDLDTTTAQTITPQPGTGGTGTLLDPSDVRQPASNPRPTGGGGRVPSQIQRELDDFLADTRGQTGAGRTRQRPEQPDTGGGIRSPQEGRDVLGGSPRDRLSGDVTRRQRQDLDTARGDFELSPDPIAARGSDRGLSPGSRVPRDPLDTRGGRIPDGSSGLTPADIGLGGGAGFAGLSADTDATGDLFGFELGGALGTGSDTDTTPDQRSGTTPDSGTGTDSGLGTDEGTAMLTALRGRTALSPRAGADERVRGLMDMAAGSVGDPTQADPTGRTGRPATTPTRPPRPPQFDLEGDSIGDDGERFEEEIGEEIFGTGIVSGEDALADIFDSRPSGM